MTHETKLGGLELPEQVGACPPCPKCGKPGLRVVYGRLTLDGRRQAARGDFIAGGCMVQASSPKWGCLSCKHTWGTLAEDLLDFLRELETRKGSGS